MFNPNHPNGLKTNDPSTSTPASSTSEQAADRPVREPNANSPATHDKPTGLLSSPGVFIIGTDTEVGKTFQACRLARSLADREINVGVYKPVASGVPALSEPSVLQVSGNSSTSNNSSNNSLGSSDAEQLHIAARSRQPLSRICPQSFAAALAPPLAAHHEGQVVDEQLLIDGAQWWLAHCDFLIVEGVGGALSPISESMVVLDLAQHLRLPLILVAANRLGVVNHTLLTIEAVRARQLQLHGIVLNTIPGSSDLQARISADNAATIDDDASRSSNRELLQRFTSVPIVDSIEELIGNVAD